MRRLDKSKDARRRARKLAARTLIKTGTKVVPDKRKKPPRHKARYAEDIYGPLISSPYA